MSQYDPRITAYFGDAVLQAGFMPLPHLMLRHYRQMGMSHVHLVFVLQLMEIAWDITNPPITVAKLAERMDVTDRAIRKWSQELMDTGLIRIYDQYDAKGTQVENAYDLSPMFRRLAALAPIKTPSGELRQRRARVGKHDLDVPHCDADALVPIVTASGKVSSATRNNHSPSSRNDGSTPAGISVHPTPEQTFSGQGNSDAGLNKETKEGIKKQPKRGEEQQQHGGADTPVVAVAQQSGMAAADIEPEHERAGRSLRWNEPLSAAEVRQSHDVLLRIGLNAPVARAVAPSLHPAEAWALCCYARGAKLGPAWVSQQVYDAQRQVPLLAAQACGFDTAGRHLAALVPGLADAMIYNVLAADGGRLRDPGPQSRLAVAPVEMDGTAAEVITCLEKAFAEQHSVRQRRHARHADPVQIVATPQRVLVTFEPDERWTQACTQLARVVTPGDWELWLQPLVALDICADHVVVGAPNVFVRDEVKSRFLPQLEAAVCTAWGHDVVIDLVIGGGIYQAG